MTKIAFDSRQPRGLEIARQIVFKRLREDRSWCQFPVDGRNFDPYVEYVGYQVPDQFGLLAQDVLWELIIQGVIAPGLNLANANLPWFHLTEYGRKVLAADKYIPHQRATWRAFKRPSQNLTRL